jgi:hypothetical protein
MKQGGFILLAGLLLGAGAFSGFYYLRTAWCRATLTEPRPELAWLKKEFHLSNAEFSRVVRLHLAYLPQCAKRCLIIEAQNQKLRQLLGQTTNVTSEIQALLLERAKTRAECESEMLKHFLAVSRTMPLEEGKRYLAWVEQQTFLNDQAMERRHHTVQNHSTDHPSRQ